MNASELVTLLESHRFNEATEDHLQRGIEALLREAGVSFEREVRLSATDRVDFLVGDVGVECKIGGSLADATRQLHRYAQHERIRELVLVTTRVRLAQVPTELNGKQVRVAATFGGLL